MAATANLFPTISSATLPSTPANEWAVNTHDMLAGANGDIPSPGPTVPGAFPLDSPNTQAASWANASTNGQGVINRVKDHMPGALAGYFGNASDEQKSTTELSLSSATPQPLSDAATNVPSSGSPYPLSAPQIEFSTSTSSLDVMRGSTQSLGVFAASTTSLAAASTVALENAPLSPQVPPPPHPTPVLGFDSNSVRVLPVPPGLSFVEGGNALGGSDSERAPFTPIPPVQDIPAAVEASPAVVDTISTPSPNPLLTHGGTHANGHTDAEEAQRAEFTRSVPPSPTPSSFSPTSSPVSPEDAAHEKTNGTVATNAHKETTVNGTPGHIFTANGVHTGTTLGAAQIAHAGAFVDEGGVDRLADENEGGENNREEGEAKEGNERKSPGKASRFVAKLKGKMHVG
ncbi:hypothetical protein DFH06DRAFT_1317536 [Mycena polygramma]|nr:hypothetical protein DFH06DRAFT_1317536 [Mycena polygramma]